MIEVPARQFVPPYPQPLVGGYTGYGDLTGGSSGSDSTSAMMPQTQDLEWVAGDTAYFTFHFPDVAWTLDDPSPTNPDITWGGPVTWRSQVRSSAYYYYGYWWPPTFPLGAFLMEFECSAVYVEGDAIKPDGTSVVLRGGMIWTGDFKWDLQAEMHTDSLDPAYYEAHTLYQGKAKVHPQYTSPTLYPPSNWPLYSFSSNPWPHVPYYLYP